MAQYFSYQNAIPSSWKTVLRRYQALPESNDQVHCNNIPFSFFCEKFLFSYKDVQYRPQLTSPKFTNYCTEVLFCKTLLIIVKSS